MEKTPYSVTVKFAPAGTPLVNGGKSLTGHIWYETHNSETDSTQSHGWSSGHKWTQGGEENIVDNDMTNYYSDDNHHISSIRIDNLSKEQFDGLNTFPLRAANGEIEGFGTNYNLLTNSCIDLVGMALADVNLADKGFDGTWYKMPDKQIDAFEEQILKHTDNQVTVDKNGEITVYHNNEQIENNEYQDNNNVNSENYEQIDHNNTNNFIDENHYLNNQDNFFGDYLNQYAEENGISHINTYDYRQFANDDNSSNGISYLNDYNLSFGSGYWNMPTISAFELESMIDRGQWDEVDNVLSDLHAGTLKLDGEISYSAQQKLIGSSTSVFAGDDFFESRSVPYTNPNEYYQSKYGYYDNSYNLSWEMNTINNSIQQYYEMQEYLAQQEYWDSVINDIQSSTNNMTNMLSGSLNNNSDGDIINANSSTDDNQIIAKVSDDPIISVKDENGIDKTMPVSEYVQYEYDNEFNNAQQAIQEKINNNFNQFPQDIKQQFDDIEQQVNQKIDDIEQDILSTELSNNENDHTENEMISFEEYLKQNSFNFDDYDLFKVVSDEEIFSMNNEHYCDCKDDNPDDWLF